MNVQHYQQTHQQSAANQPTSAIQKLSQRPQIEKYQPARPDEELFAEKRMLEAQLLLVIMQLEEGCKKVGCQNKKACLTANPQLKPASRTAAITQALTLLRDKSLEICVR